MVPPHGVNHNACYRICDQILVLTVDGSALFVQVCTGTLYFYHDEVEVYVNAYGEAYLGFVSTESPILSREMSPLPGPLDPSSYRAAGMEHGALITADAAHPARPWQATLAVAYQIAAGRYPLMVQASLATVTDDFEKARAAKTVATRPLNKPLVAK